MATTGLSEMFGIPQSNEMPSNPGMAFALALTFVRLGGDFGIDSNGRRYLVRDLDGPQDEFPQLPDTEPHQQFLNPDQWEGAMRLLEVLSRRMTNEDRELVFNALASVAVDDRKFLPSIEEPTRRAA